MNEFIMKIKLSEQVSGFYLKRQKQISVPLAKICILLNYYVYI